MIEQKLLPLRASSMSIQFWRLRKLASVEPGSGIQIRVPVSTGVSHTAEHFIVGKRLMGLLWFGRPNFDWLSTQYWNLRRLDCVVLSASLQNFIDHGDQVITKGQLLIFGKDVPD
jgi:hypothetical protein